MSQLQADVTYLQISAHQGHVSQMGEVIPLHVSGEASFTEFRWFFSVGLYCSVPKFA